MVVAFSFLAASLKFIPATFSSSIIKAAPVAMLNDDSNCLIELGHAACVCLFWCLLLASVGGGHLGVVEGWINILLALKLACHAFDHLCQFVAVAVFLHSNMQLG